MKYFLYFLFWAILPLLIIYLQNPDRFRSEKRIGIALFFANVFLIFPLFFWVPLGLAGTTIDLLLGYVETLQAMTLIPLQYLFITFVLLLVRSACLDDSDIKTIHFLELLGLLLPIVVFTICFRFFTPALLPFEGRIMTMHRIRGILVVANMGIPIPLASALFLSSISRTGYWVGILCASLSGAIYEIFRI